MPTSDPAPPLPGRPLSATSPTDGNFVPSQLTIGSGYLSHSEAAPFEDLPAGRGVARRPDEPRLFGDVGKTYGHRLRNRMGTTGDGINFQPG